MIVRKQDSIVVIMEKISKETHFILLKSNYKARNIAKKFMKEIFQVSQISQSYNFRSRCDVHIKKFEGTIPRVRNLVEF